MLVLVAQFAGAILLQNFITTISCDFSDKVKLSERIDSSEITKFAKKIDIPNFEEPKMDEVQPLFGIGEKLSPKTKDVINKGAGKEAVATVKKKVFEIGKKVSSETNDLKNKAAREAAIATDKVTRELDELVEKVKKLCQDNFIDWLINLKNILWAAVLYEVSGLF